MPRTALHCAALHCTALRCTAPLATQRPLSRAALGGAAARDRRCSGCGETRCSWQAAGAPARWRRGWVLMPCRGGAQHEETERALQASRSSVASLEALVAALRQQAAEAQSAADRVRRGRMPAGGPHGLTGRAGGRVCRCCSAPRTWTRSWRRDGAVLRSLSARHVRARAASGPCAALMTRAPCSSRPTATAPATKHRTPSASCERTYARRSAAAAGGPALGSASAAMRSLRTPTRRPRPPATSSRPSRVRAAHARLRHCSAAVLSG